MSSNPSKTLLSMSTTMNQQRNNINRIDAKTTTTNEVVETLLKAKRCWDEAAAVASEAGESSNQINAAEKSLEMLRATIETCLKKFGWSWDELEERAKRLLGKSEQGGLTYRLTAEGGLNMDMGEMKM